MKRPIGLMALAVAALAGIWLWLAPAPLGELRAVARDGASFLLEDGSTYVVWGRVSRIELRAAGERSQYWIYLDSVTIQWPAACQAAELSQGLICKTGDQERPRLGSRILVSGRFAYFSTATNPGEFDLARYYHILGIGGSLEKSEILQEQEPYSKVREGLFCLRSFWKKRLYECFPEKEASVLCTMLLGDKTSLDAEIKDLYQRNGIVHILSISGLHITIIGMGIYRLLRRLNCPVPMAALTGAAVLLAYGIMTGMGVSACRAIGMYLIRMLGELVGRTYDMLTALGVMGILMLIRQPGYLCSSGFLLSFGSIGGVGILLPAMLPENRGGTDGGIHFGRKCWEALAPGLAITLFTLPIHLCFYYEIPVYSVFLNLLVLPAMGLVMGLGLAVMLVPGLGFLAMADSLILQGYEWLCRWFDKLPGHTWTPGCPAPWQVVVYYLLILAFLWRRKGASKRRMFGKARPVLLVLAVWVIGIRLHFGLEVTFLDVGQGDGIFLRTDGGEIYFFDGGSSSEKSVGTYTILPFLKYQGVARIDAAFISHPDLDHMSGMLELLENGAEEGIFIDKIILPDIGEEKREEDFESILQALRVSAQEPPISVYYLARGVCWQSGETRFTCLHPPAGCELEDKNAYSQCFLVQNRGFSMLLTGDVEQEGEVALFQELSLRGEGPITLLKVAHHGSRNSTSEEILKLLQPRIAVISYGEGNSYGHPHQELWERLEQIGCRIYATPRTGALSLFVGKHRFRLKPYL